MSWEVRCSEGQRPRVWSCGLGMAHDVMRYGSRRAIIPENLQQMISEVTMHGSPSDKVDTEKCFDYTLIFEVHFRGFWETVG